MKRINSLGIDLFKYFTFFKVLRMTPGGCGRLGESLYGWGIFQLWSRPRNAYFYNGYNINN